MAMSKTQYIYLALALLVIVVLVGMLIKVKEGFCYIKICQHMYPEKGQGFKRVGCTMPWIKCPSSFWWNGHEYKDLGPKQRAYWSATAKNRINYDTDGAEITNFADSIRL
jgi:hypothetical protein